MPEERSIDSSRRPVIPTTLETGPGRTPEPPFHGPISSCPLIKEGVFRCPDPCGNLQPLCRGRFWAGKEWRKRAKVQRLRICLRKTAANGLLWVSGGQESGDMKGFAGNGTLVLYIIVRSPFSRGFSPEVFSRVEKNFSGPYISAAKASLTCPGYLGIHLGELIAVFPE